jgi:DUF4097 and DUF4098 domain-containing protein YvlB
MPRISFTFSGCINGADIKTALEIATGKDIDVSTLSGAELVSKLRAGELAISLRDGMDNGEVDQVELQDYETE